MSDMYKITNSLRIDNVFVDGDTRSITLKNPKATIESSQIAELNSFMQTNNVLIGDKAAGTFGRIKQAVRIKTEDIIFDISGSDE